jgi:hypothetical protein
MQQKRMRAIYQKGRGLAVSIVVLLFLLGPSRVLGGTISPQKPKGPYSFDIKASSEKLVKALEARFRVPPAKVALVRKGEVLLESSGEIPLGLELVVYKPGKSIVDKESGKAFPGFDIPMALVQVKRREGKLYLAQVTETWGQIKKGYKVKGPEMVYVNVASPKVEGDVPVDAKDLETVFKFSLGESLFFRLLAPRETLPDKAYGVLLHPVVTSGGTMPVLGCYVDSLVTRRSLFALQENLKLVKSSSYTEIMKKRTLMETGEWGGYQMAVASRVFKEKMTSVAVADVDGDGKEEIILLGPQALRVCKLKKKEFQKVYQYKLSTRGAYARKYTRVDVGDINGNGRPEVFITCVVEDLMSGYIRPRLASMVLELYGKKFKVLEKNAPYYFMVVHPRANEKGRPVLLAQKMGEYQSFEGPVVQLVWNGKKYVRAQKPVYPFISKFGHLYGLIWDDFKLDGKLEVAVVDNDNYLSVYDVKGRPLWESPESLGVVKYDYFNQTPRFPRFPAMKDFNPEDVAVKRYMPRRIVSAFMEGEGRMALFTVVNDVPSFVLAGVKLEAPWQGINGRVVKLAFVGSGKAYGAYFDILWEGPKFKDLYAQDLALGDVDQDGVLDVVFLSYNKKIGKVRVDIYPLSGL